MCDAFPGKTPGPEAKTADTTDPERARAWAQKLAAKLASNRGN